MIRLLDRQGDWLLHHLGARAQLRIGVACLWLSVPFYAYWPLSGEPAGIYAMSALALTLSGAAFIVGAEVLLHREENE